MPTWGHQIKLLDRERLPRCDWRDGEGKRCREKAAHELSYCCQVPGQSHLRRSVGRYCGSHINEVCRGVRSAMVQHNEEMKSPYHQLPIDLQATPHSGPETSAEAAASMAEQAASLEAQVLRYIKRCGHWGATDEEIQLALAMAGNTERPRRWSLSEKGLVVDSGRARLTTANRRAVVWVAAEFRREGRK